MEQLLVFIETMAIDEKLSWRVNGKRPGEVYEITWNRKFAPMAWGIRRGFEEQYEMFSNSDFRIALQCSGVDLVHFERLLSSNILSQAVFADMVIDQIKQIFGAETVARSVGESRKFLSSIVDLASSLNGEKPKQKNVVNQTKQAPVHVPVKAGLLH